MCPDMFSVYKNQKRPPLCLYKSVIKLAQIKVGLVYSRFTRFAVDFHGFSLCPASETSHISVSL